MSLRALHICFITLSIFLAFGFGLWGLHDYDRSKTVVHLWLGMASFAGAVLLVVYLYWFLAKMKRIMHS